MHGYPDWFWLIFHPVTWIVVILILLGILGGVGYVIYRMWKRRT